MATKYSQHAGTQPRRMPNTTAAIGRGSASYGAAGAGGAGVGLGAGLVAGTAIGAGIGSAGGYPSYYDGYDNGPTVLSQPNRAMMGSQQTYNPSATSASENLSWSERSRSVQAEENSANYAETITPEPVYHKPKPVCHKPKPVGTKPKPVCAEPKPVGAKPKPACAPAEPVCDDGVGYGYGWIIWIIVIFIFILFIVMGCFWAFQPACVTREPCDDGQGGLDEGGLDIGWAAAYAFFFTFFLVLIILAIWWCTCRRR